MQWRFGWLLDAPGHSSKDADLESQLAHVVASLTGVLAGLGKPWPGDEF